MKTIKFICFMAAMAIMPRVWAGEPLETINLHHRNGNVIATSFTEFNRIELSGSNLIFVGRNTPVSVRLADISKITFGDSRTEFLIPVTFGIVGEARGTLYVSVVESGRIIRSGEEIEEGLTIRFKVEPDAGYQVKGWYINGAYEANGTTERKWLLNRKSYADGLHVEVEFEKKAVISAIQVTFATTGNGSGTLTAFEMENGVQTRKLASGEEVEVGHMVLFKAEPDYGSEIRRWRINGDYVLTTAVEQSVLLEEGLYMDGLQLEVEFEKKGVGVEDVEALNNTLNVYVQRREINIESSFYIERVELWDVGGRLLRAERSAQPSHQMVIPVGNVVSGVYVLRIRTTEKEETRKVIIR